MNDNEDFYDMETENTGKKKKGCAKLLIWFMVIGLIAGSGLFYFKYYFVFGEGVKAGQLNYVVNKGYLFKTYEGKMIQAGFRGGSGSTMGVQSNEFVFSVERKDIAEILMRSGGKEVELHYKEYKGALPWRGYSEFVVDSIIAIK